jgi:hypothetical protein
MSKCRVFYWFPAFTDPCLPTSCRSSEGFHFSDNAPCRSTRWERSRGKSLLGRGKYLLFESFIACTVHIAARQQLSELSLQCIFGLLLVPHLLCARLIERLAFPAYLYLLQYITGSFILRRIFLARDLIRDIRRPKQKRKPPSSQ